MGALQRALELLSENIVAGSLLVFRGKTESIAIHVSMGHAVVRRWGERG